jgi:putative flippase GtrA
MTNRGADDDKQALTLVPRSDRGAFVRYAIVGVAQNATFYGLALILIYRGFAAWQATAILFPIAVGTSFLLNRSWSFAGRQRTSAAFQKYFLVYAAAYPVSIVMTWAQERAGVPSWLASLITLFVSAAGIFLALNLWVFGRASTAETAPPERC